MNKHSCKTHRRNRLNSKRSKPHPSHTRGTFHRRLQPLYTEKHKVSYSCFLPNTKPVQHSCSHSNAICNQRFKNRIELRTQEQPLVAKHIGGTIRDRNDRSRNRRTDEVPFIVACSHFTRKNARFRAPASSPQHTPRNIHAAIPMRSATSDSIQPPTFFPFVTISLLHHSPSSSLPFFTTPLHHHFPSSPLPFIITSLLHHSPSSSPLPFIITSLLHHSPSSSLPFIITSLLHHFPSSPLPFIITSLHHHFPSSPFPFIITPLHHHFPSSPLPFIITSLLHHFPSSSLPFFTTPLHHHSPSSSLPFFTTSLHHHFPSSPLPFIITSLLHHSPSSSLPFFTTSPSRSPPFIIVNSFLMY